MIFQVCDLKEDQYYCLDCAVKYLQTKKAAQRKNCKLYFTHSKDEITTIIKDVNRRFDDSDDEDSDETDTESIPIKRISELGKVEKKPKPPPKEEPMSPNSSFSSSSGMSSLNSTSFLTGT